MACSSHSTEAERVTYHGEVWTDGGGYAAVELPVAANALMPPFEYELRDLEPSTTARVTAELTRGRFTIATDEPHVKVGWQVTGQRGTDQAASDRERSVRCSTRSS